MESTVVIAAVALGLEVIIAVVVGVWAIGQVRVTTEKLGATINHLNGSINRMNSWLNDVDSKVGKHGERLAAIETKLEVVKRQTKE